MHPEAEQSRKTAPWVEMLTDLPKYIYHILKLGTSTNAMVVQAAEVCSILQHSVPEVQLVSFWED